MVRYFWTTFGTSWLQLCHCTWWIFFSNLSKHLTSILWVWILFLIYLSTNWAKGKFLICINWRKLVFGFGRSFSIDAYWAFGSSMTLSSSRDLVCHVSVILRWASSFIIILSLSMEIDFVQTVATLMII